MDYSEGDCDYMIKLILIGDSDVGKTSLVARFKNPDPKKRIKTHTTIGYDFCSKFFEQDDKLIQVHLWDTTGQEKYRSLIKNYYRKAVGAFLVYDITKQETFERLPKWLEELKENCEPGCEIMLVGNKADLESIRAVKEEEGDKYSKDNGLMFYEASALNGYNVKKIFEFMINKIINNIKEQEKQRLEKSNHQDSKLTVSKASFTSRLSAKIETSPQKKCKC